MIDTSTDTDFEIEGCKFENNKAVSSTIIMIKAFGSISRC